MNIHSVFFKLNLLFVVALAATVMAGFLAMAHITRLNQTDLQIKSRLILHTWRTEKTKPTALIAELGFVEVKPPWKSVILKKFKQRHRATKNFPPKARLGAGKILRSGRYLYLWIRTRHIKILLRQSTGQWRRMQLPLALFGGMTLLLAVIYWLLRRSLMPIRRLQQEIVRYGEGGYPEQEVFSAHQDEIAEVGNAFYTSAHRAQRLIRSRQLFVRNIFHELNTPVTKGKILAELTEDPKTRSMLDSIFSRLASLLKELAQMEQITSQDTALHARPVRIIELIDQARDLLYIDEPIPTNVTDEMIEADFGMMGIAFKNLIDNAQKYGENLTINATEHGTEFISEGDPLAHPLAYYTEPFSAGDTRTNTGFGLGLYIVDEIAKKHGMVLQYRYENGRNIFALQTHP